MATLVACTVDTGGTGDYPSLNAGEAANFGATGADLVSNDEYVVCTCICTDGNADTTETVMSGQATDLTHTILITVPSGYRSTTFPTSGNQYRFANRLKIGVANATLSHMSISRTMAGDGDYSLYLDAFSNVTTDSCVVTATVGARTGCYGIFAKTPSGGSIFISNCIVYDIGAGIGVQSSSSSAGTLYISHVTSVDSATGFVRSTSGVIVAKNCISFGNTTADYTGTFHADSTNNGYSNGTGPSGGSAAVNLGTDGNGVFRDYAGNDFHLKQQSTNPAYAAGADLRTDANLPVTLDIDGETRAATPCIGADEFSISSGGVGQVIALGTMDPRKRQGLRLTSQRTMNYW